AGGASLGRHGPRMTIFPPSRPNAGPHPPPSTDPTTAGDRPGGPSFRSLVKTAAPEARARLTGPVTDGGSTVSVGG
ncbi:MAG: hypothetical protein ACLP1X_00900, partial [Polyangiaceae bacterium]